jgi:hypothetical protein
VVSGWRALDDRRLDLLFENPRDFAAELSEIDGDPRALIAEASETPQSWRSDFEGHLLRLVHEEGDGGMVFGLYLDGEPVGTLEALPPGWILEGFEKGAGEPGGTLL